MSRNRSRRSNGARQLVPDGSIDRLRADIDRGRTGDKIDWPDPAAAPLGIDEEAAGAPIPAAAGQHVHRAEAAAPGVPRQNHRGFGAAWIIVAVTVAVAAIVVGWFAA